jgi:hypothetical protein
VTETPTAVPSTGPTATTTPNPTPTPDSTPNPTLTPDPTPHPTPAPTPCTARAPSLVGEHRRDAGRLWSAAGFTGVVTDLDGHGNYVIASQDRTAGRSYPCDSGVTIGP